MSRAGLRGALAYVRFTPESGHGPISDEHSDARQDNPDFGELAGLRINLD